nr:MAG TPA: hypothetical protein [Caudoviricetes sp.]
MIIIALMRFLESRKAICIKAGETQQYERQRKQ